MVTSRNYCIIFYILTIIPKGFLCKDTKDNSDNGDGSNDVVSTDTEYNLLDKEYGVKYASACEVCKYLAVELEDRFDKLGKTSEVIETGYQIDGPKKRVKYNKSELYFIESLEGVCEKLLEYNIHKERKDSTRFAKGMSTTFKTLHSLVDKGVKVDLGIPMELWDSPSAEITALKQQCENYLEKYDNIIEQWYWGNRDQQLQQYLCRDRVLQKDQQSCLDEIPASVIRKVKFDQRNEKKSVKFDKEKDSIKFIEDSIKSDEDKEPVVSTDDLFNQDEFRAPLSPPISPKKSETSDAIVQTEFEQKKVLIDRSIQTDECWLRHPLESYYEHYLTQVKADSLGYKPIYSIPNRQGKEPPLKIGLSLPRGKKRKVFYPGHDSDQDSDQ